VADELYTYLPASRRGSSSIVSTLSCVQVCRTEVRTLLDCVIELAQICVPVNISATRRGRCVLMNEV